jgi:hypothetical protein
VFSLQISDLTDMVPEKFKLGNLGDKTSNKLNIHFRRLKNQLLLPQILW